MKIKSQRDFWSGLLFLAVGLGFAWGATFYRLGDSAQPGPGFFPLGLAILFKALSVERADGDPVGAIAWRPLVAIVGAVVLFGWTLPHLGLVLALPLLVVVSALGGSEFRWREVLASALVLTVLSWAIFIWGLKLPITLLPAMAGG